MPELQIWEKILVGVIALLVLLWFRPGIKSMMQQSREAQKDWKGFLLPLVAMVLFIILLINLAR